MITAQPRSLADDLMDVFHETAAWPVPYRHALLRNLLGYAEQAYQHAGAPHGATLVGVWQWLVEAMTPARDASLIELSLVDQEALRADATAWEELLAAYGVPGFPTASCPDPT
jgi:hypothetical protein